MGSGADASSMEPLFPEPGPLEEPALAVVREAGALGGQLHPVTRASVADLLRAINTYHSDTPKGPVRLGFPVSAVGFYFPQLFSQDVLD